MGTAAVQRFRSKLVKDSSTESLFCQGFFNIPELRLLTSNFPSFPVEVSSVFKEKNFFCAQCERSWEGSQIKPRAAQQEESNLAQHHGQPSGHPMLTLYGPFPRNHAAFFCELSSLCSNWQWENPFTFPECYESLLQLASLAAC